MNKSDLLELREIFRNRMQKEDFCIGEEQVERLFRELLGEPEPEPIKYTGPTLSASEINEIFERVISKKGLQSLFERNDVFYHQLNSPIHFKRRK